MKLWGHDAMMSGDLWKRVGTGIGGAAILSAVLLCRAQYSPSNNGPQIQGLPSPHQGLSGLEADPQFEARRLRAMNIDRQKSMVSDTNKLVKLARQLDAEVASNPTDALTPEQLHKVAEIEKLAHNVKTKMAQSFEGGPRFIQPAVLMGGPSRQ
jgi:hypothetical protein